MQNEAILSLLSEWREEFNLTLMKENSLCIALFSTDKELLYANNTMISLFKGEPHKSFINPTFDNLLSLSNSSPLIFDGSLTLGDYASINTSILAQIYRKENKLLVIGGVNTTQLIGQNSTMHQLNREISNLQRQLIKEKHTLEETLNQLNIDISERKRAEEALRESEFKFRTVADYTNDWEYWEDENNKIIYMSPSCERITGYSPKEFISSPELLLKIVHPDDLNLLTEHQGKVYSKEFRNYSDEIVFRIINKDSSVAYIEHICRPVKSENEQYLVPYQIISCNFWQNIISNKDLILEL